MTVTEKMKEVFGIGFMPDDYHSGMIACAGMSCSDCPLKSCDGDGINEWLRSEYHEGTERKKEEKIIEEKTEEYKRGFRDGKNATIDDLSKIFKRR